MNLARNHKAASRALAAISKNFVVSVRVGYCALKPFRLTTYEAMAEN